VGLLHATIFLALGAVLCINTVLFWDAVAERDHLLHGEVSPICIFTTPLAFFVIQEGFFNAFQCF
jgi:hypothetical protein